MASQRFSVQAFLAEMRQEQREDHKALTDKVDEGFKSIASSMSAHELEDAKQFGAIDKRLEAVENTRRSMHWLGATVIVAFVGVALDFIFNHLRLVLGSR